MGLTLITPPTVWPVTLAEAKQHCRVTHSLEDALIEGYIKAATRHLETSLGISIATQTWKLTLDEFADAIELPRGPVTSITSVTYSDEAGATQTASTSLYTADLASDPQRVVLNTDEGWPDTLDAVNAVSVSYTAGMIEDDDLKTAILFQVQLLYERGADAKAAEVISGVIDSHVQPYRRVMV